MFRFIDLFAGIGGFRLAFSEIGGDCIFSSEIDRFARATYAANFGEEPSGDITAIDPATIPDHEILLAGFPCQPFSLAGVSRHNSLGREHGFRDLTRGTLFFRIAAILDAKRPPIFVLENVRNLLAHDRGRTFELIGRTFDELDYVWQYAILDAADYLPQHRERVFLLGFDRRFFGDAVPDFSFPGQSRREGERSSIGMIRLGDILEREVDARYTLSDKLWEWHQNYLEKHRSRGNGFGYSLVNADTRMTRTLSARYYKDGAEILVEQPNVNPRRLTPRECARLMGFPDSFQIPVSDTQAYKQFGNSVALPVVRAIAVALHDILHQVVKKVEQQQQRVTKER